MTVFSGPWLLAVRGTFTRSRWLPCVVVLGIPMLFFLVYRLVALSSIVALHRSAETTHASGYKLSGVVLGVCEDLVTTTLVVAALACVELIVWRVARVLQPLVSQTSTHVTMVLQSAGRIVQYAAVFALTVVVLAPFAADLTLVRNTKTRLADSKLSSEKRRPEIRHGVVVSVCVAAVFTAIYAACIDLTHGIRSSDEPAIKSRADSVSLMSSRRSLLTGSSGLALEVATPTKEPGSSGRTSEDELAVVPISSTNEMAHNARPRRRRYAALAFAIAFASLVATTWSVSHTVSPVVAAVALNASLNQLVSGLFGVQFQQRGAAASSSTPNAEAEADAAADFAVEGSIESAAKYLHSDTESYTLFKDDVLFRNTTGFNGPLAFDVDVDEANPPNVLIIGIESFRYMDSLLLAANTTAGELMKRHNLTVAPQFDRWAQRGVAFPNMWSSWQTSRSLEAILFGQLPLYTNDSGTRGGRIDTNLSGMPQLFKQKGYETVFTTGSIVTFDEWDSFLPAHGFDTLIAAPEMKTIAQRDYGINSRDWDGPALRGFNWGVHDDVSFDILGDLMLNKTREQTKRVERGEPKQPFFLNHYTISSHHEFNQWPRWVDNVTVPDFTPLCEGWESECELIQKYAKLRYFTDMELGKFMERMEAAGVLEDTIVVLLGDHGQSPEFGLTRQLYYQTACQHVASAMVAEGRLGRYAGTMLDDVTHQYDLLNTIMDIVGVPAGGFLQTGVGRSLKRAIPKGERVVYSNNPKLKMSVVRGHERFVHDRDSSDARLYNTVEDPLEKNNLLPARSGDEQAEWLARRTAARQLSTYFKLRWAGKCLTQVDC